MLKKSKTVSFQSPIVQDNETSDRIPVYENLKLNLKTIFILDDSK